MTFLLRFDADPEPTAEQSGVVGHQALELALIIDELDRGVGRPHADTQHRLLVQPGLLGFADFERLRANRQHQARYNKRQQQSQDSALSSHLISHCASLKRRRRTDYRVQAKSAPMEQDQERFLDERDLQSDPMAQLDHWLGEARQAGLREPTAMNLATVSPQGKPRSRMVLFKGFVESGLAFFTDYQGDKGREITQNPAVALTFWWDILERQVRIEGTARKLDRKLSEQYFRSRPRISQISAFTSHQSEVVDSRATLETRFKENQVAFEGGDIPFPGRWGGFIVEPEQFEFWQGRRGRLHDRLRYRRLGQGWTVDRLEP